ncbi:hypothetical protein [Streptomyces sp. NPDC058697]|uniref:hypothetical protein n=1 Tax=Streptomyces sp. NPDC058697 TaxID=3346605 RepID=UPI003665BB27
MQSVGPVAEFRHGRSLPLAVRALGHEKSLQPVPVYTFPPHQQFRAGSLLAGLGPEQRAVGIDGLAGGMADSRRPGSGNGLLDQRPEVVTVQQPRPLATELFMTGYLVVLKPAQSGPGSFELLHGMRELALASVQTLLEFVQPRCRGTLLPCELFHRPLLVGKVLFQFSSVSGDRLQDAFHPRHRLRIPFREGRESRGVGTAR